MKTLILTLFALTQLQITTPAKAENIHQGELIALKAALDVRDQFITALEKKDFTEMTQKSMGNAVGVLANNIRKEFDDEDMASELEQIWTQDLAAFYSLGWRDLGDHAPFIPKIEEFLKTMADKYGTVIYSLPVVDDIRTLNFAIPVVFHPKGDWQTAEVDNRIEYRKHFIPFANIVTFYGSLLACNYYAQKSGQPEMKKICQPAAEKLKFAMGRYVAPQVSDWIFAQTNKSITITDQQRRYTTAQDLAAAIRF
jgi:hypothetical protein